MKRYIPFILLYLLLTPLDSHSQGPGASSLRPAPEYERAQSLLPDISSQNSESSAKIRKAVTDPSWYVRGKAALALGKLDEKNALVDLSNLLKDESWYVRICALEALAEKRDPAAGAAILPLLESSDSFIVARAAEALGEINYTLSTESLIKLTGHDDENVKRSAAIALGTMKSKSAYEALLVILKDDSPGVRAAAAGGLGRMGDVRAEPLIRESLKEAGDNAWVFAEALYRLGNREYLNLLTAALKNVLMLKFPEVFH